MVDDFWNCPYTGGKEPCNPACVLFVREFAALSGKESPNYCRSFGIVDKNRTADRLIAETSRK